MHIIRKSVFDIKNVESIFPGGIKATSIGQSIVHAVRPCSSECRVYPYFATASWHMHSNESLFCFTLSGRLFLNHLGLCYSYSEVQNYEWSESVHQGTEICCYTPGHCIQFVADNVDQYTYVPLMAKAHFISLHYT